MALTFDFLAREGDACRCGRRASKHHCPFCGSFQVRAYKTPLRRYNTETKMDEEFVVFKCEKCGGGFDETAFKTCEAPEYLTKPQKAERDLRRTVNAMNDNHPLTRREVKIARGVQNVQVQSQRSLIERLSDDPARPVNADTGEPIKGKAETFSEFVSRREAWLLSRSA